MVIAIEGTHVGVIRVEAAALPPPVAVPQTSLSHRVEAALALCDGLS